jgi:CBS domain-containing protein
MKLKRRGVQLPGMEDANPLKALFVSDVVDRSPDVLPESASFEALIGLLVNSDHTEFFVVDARGELLGAISLSELRRVLVEREYLRSVVVAGDLMDTTRLTLTEQEDLDVALRILDEENVDEIAVVDASAPRRLVGSLHRRDLIAAYREEQARRDAAGALAAGVHVVERVHEVEVAEDFVLRDVAAPHAIAGRTLGELDLRARTGAMVLLIRKSNRARGADVRVPSPSDRIEDGDVLIAAGSREALARLEAL